MESTFKMDVGQNAGADKPVFTLELRDLTVNPNIKFDELDGENVPDEVLVDLLESVQDDQGKTLRNPNGLDDLTATTSAAVTPKSKRFRTLIMMKSTIFMILVTILLLKEHKQTTWGISVFRGKTFRRNQR